MQKKILVIGSIALIIVAIFIFFPRTDKEKKLKTEGQKIKNENIAKRNSSSKIKSPKPQKSTEKGLEQLSDEELEAALDYLNSLDEESTYEEKQKKEDIQPDVTSDTEVSEAEDSENKISPELKKRFRIYKEYVDKMRALVRKQASLQGRWEKLNNRADEIADMHIVSKEEREELQQVLKELERLNTILDPIREGRAQIKNEYNEYFQTHYGMSLRQFHKTYFDAFRVWEKNQ